MVPRRRVLLCLAWIGVVLILNSRTARAEPLVPPVDASMPTPLDGLGADLAGAFTSRSLPWLESAVAISGAMALGGADQAVRVGVQRDLFAPAYADGALYAGYILPATVAPALYLIGLAVHDQVTVGAGSAVLQALGMTLLATSVLKIAAGRPYPLNGGDPNAPDRLDHPEYARQFRPFQALWPLPAWPSGHTSATVSVVAALSAYYPEQVWIPLFGYPLGVLIGFGMLDGDRHWASDVVAGGLLGYAIGDSVGSAFRRRVRSRSDSTAGVLNVLPLVAPTFGGLSASGAW